MATVTSQRYGTDNSRMYNYSTVFSFERSLQYSEWQPFMQRYWTVSFLIVIVYVSSIYIGRRLMQSRAKFELRRPLILWNLALAVFSICGALRSVPEIIYVLLHNGYHYSACHPSFLNHPTSAFWTILFVWSKVPELCDTIFVILRKQTLLFLHWFHHATVMIWAIYSYTYGESSGRWNQSMNYSVHAVMYSYYLMKSLKISVPKAVSVLITGLQLLQMCLGFAVNIYVMKTKMADPDSCAVENGNNRVSFTMYFIYLLLFVGFFYNSYLKKRGPTNQHRYKNGVSNGVHNGVEKNGKEH